MKLSISITRTINDVQQDFNAAYPFLKIEFYPAAGKSAAALKQRLDKTALLQIAGDRREGEVEITDSMTVGQLEKIFRDRFGIIAQVSRKSGTLWLETTMTDNWTLRQQNDHGKELSEPSQKNRAIGDVSLEDEH